MTADFTLLSSELVTAEATEYQRRVANLSLLPIEYASLLTTFLKHLDEDSRLTNIEKERRITALFSHSQLPVGLLRVFALSARDIKNPILRNGIARLLPPDFKSLTSAKEQTAAPDSQRLESGLASHSDTESPHTSAEARFELSNEAADVVFLSLDEDQASRKLLEGKFTALRYSTLAELEDALNTNEDICAVIVEDSFLSTLSKDGQKKLLSTLSAYSTFIWLKLSETNLLLTRDEVSDIISEARCTLREPSLKQVLLTNRTGIQERDLASIATCRDSLARDKSASLFVPGEIGDGELRLLVAALTDFVRRKHFRLKASVTSIRTKFVQSGRPDDAKVAVVRVNELRIPIVIKIASGLWREIIKDEARRFHTFIESGDKDLHPEVHLHGKSALMIFGLIESGDDDQEPAPTLDEVLKGFWLSEMYGNDLAQKHEQIIKAYNRAIKKVTQLNTIRCQEKGFECKANPYLEELKKMESRGFDWGLGQSALQKRQDSENLIQPASQRAVAQGDLHTRNILLRGENGFLIDYAYSGPGHPCTDLVRLELSLFFNYFTPFVTEQVLIDLQRDLTHHHSSSPQVLSKYPEVFRSHTNRLCIEMCIIAREAVGTVLKSHALGWEHYRAIKLLAAWQALQVSNLQRSLVRVVIAAL
jgi:hypothetical protein